MAGIKVEVTSREMIKPASPTPHHLDTLKLSFIDQFAPPIYIPLIFFYENNDLPSSTAAAANHHHFIQKSELLKQSLAQVLTHFYPLAGTLQGDNSISCNDQGVEFISSKVSNTLAETIEDPPLEELKRLLPFEPFGSNNNVVVGVQVNHFTGCGGMAIGVCISHKIADGTAAVAFMNAWAAMARGDGECVMLPKFDSVSHFPPNDLLNEMTITTGSSITQEKIVTKRFIFDEKMLSTLKEKASPIKAPTRVEAVSAFIWEIIAEKIKAQDDPKIIISAASHAVNLRMRMEPPLSQETFGNFWWFTVGTTSIVQGFEIMPSDLAGHLRGAIKKIDNDFIKTIHSGECLLELQKAHEFRSSGAVEFCNFSSWCRFPMYDVDFGWGAPVWVCTTTLPFKNLVLLLSTKSGDGIEAWVNMAEDDVPLFDRRIDQLLSPQP